jgi:predicted membrane protein
VTVWKEEMSATNKAATGTLVSGLVLAGVGIVLLLDKLGILNSDVLWRLWPLVFAVGGVIRMIESNSPKDRVWGGFLISIGALLTLHEFGLIRYGIGQLWPLLLIAAGVLLAWHSNDVREGRADFNLPAGLKDRVRFNFPQGVSGGPLGAVAFFGGIERRVEGLIVERSEIVAIFGGFKIDLVRADMEGEQAVIVATAIFGGGEIIVPEWWRVSVEGIGVFGGYVDKTRYVPRPDRPLKTLIVRGAAVFGGIEVKSY